MFRKLEDFFGAYEHTVSSTCRVMEAMDDGCLGQSVADGHRTLGRMAWHLVISIPEMMGRTGLRISSVGLSSPTPASASEILEAYRKVTAELVEAMGGSWTDETLLVTDDMYGGGLWPRGMTLSVLLNHEVHHRGQMTVLLRQAGRKAPGVFGPAKEEWVEHGMEEPPG